MNEGSEPQIFAPIVPGIMQQLVNPASHRKMSVILVGIYMFSCTFLYSQPTTNRIETVNIK